MTDAELNLLEHFAKSQGDTITVELIAELRQTRKERNYLAGHRPVRYCPTLQKWETCDLPDFDGPHLPQQCVQCWLDAAREATSCLMN